jgi:hypothetical protein
LFDCCSAFNLSADRTGAKKVHYIGSVNLGISLARVVSIILTVEGYACAAAARHIPKTAITRWVTGPTAFNGTRRHGWRAVTSRSNGFALKQ